MKKIFLFVIVSLFVLSCGNQAQSNFGEGSLKIVIGNVKIEHGGQMLQAKVGDTFVIGDKIITGDKSAAVASIGNGVADFELQQNSIFVFNDEKEVEIVKGNVWLQVNKKFAKGEEYTLRTPTAVAAVRGTKMFAFQMGDISGMCHCEGTVDFSGKNNDYKHQHNKDHLVLTRNGVTILLTAEDVPFIVEPGSDHKHSNIENSPLGEKGPEMTPEIMEKFMKVVNRKFAEAEQK